MTFEDILNHRHWRHRIDLGDGRFTPGQPNQTWESLGLPDDLSGMSFLDVGASDGKFAFEAERRGATEVKAVDIWDGEETGADTDIWEYYTSKDGFNLVHEYLDSAVESERVGVQNLSPERIGRFDCVLCKDVLPFVEEPLRSIKNLVNVTNKRLFIKCHISRSLGGSPGMEFVDENTTKWWPNVEGLLKMVEYAGATDVNYFYHQSETDRTEVGMIYSAQLGSGVSLYHDVSLDEEVTTTPPDPIYRDIKVLYEYNDACRIKFTHDKYPSDAAIDSGEEPPRQAWIKASELTSTSSGKESTAVSLGHKAFKIVRNQGVRTLVNKGLGRLSDDPPSWVVLTATPG